MGLWSWLFGGSTTAAAPAPIHLARGRGYTFEVVGESYRQDLLNAICGGKCEDGHALKVRAQLCLIDGNKHDPNAVGVLIEGKPVAYIPRHLAAAIRDQLKRISPDGRPVTCDAKIVGGWDRGDGDEGHYGLKLSLADPLRAARSV